MSEPSTENDPYETVLADLRAKREQIDQAIVAIESLRGASPVRTPGSVAGANGAGNAAQQREASPSDDLLGMSIAEAAKKLLANKRTTLKNPEIAALFRAGGLMLNSKDWINTIGAVLTRRANEVGDIVKVGRGTWGLKEWYPNRSFKKEKSENGEKGEAEATPSTSAPAQP